MTYSFEEFTQVHSKKRSNITLTESNSFGFTSKFVEDENLKDFKYVTLYYDRVAKVVGFRFHSDASHPHKFALIKSKNYGSYVSAMSFMNANEIDPLKFSAKYDWTTYEDPVVGKLYVITLKEHPIANNEQPMHVENTEPPKPEEAPPSPAT